MITSCDSLMSFSLLLQHVILQLSYDNLPTDAGSVFILLFSVLVGLFQRCSAFASILLTVSRTIQVKSPFYHLRRRAVYWSFAWYLVFWSGFAMYDVVYGFTSTDDSDYVNVAFVDWYSVEFITGAGFVAKLFSLSSDLLYFAITTVF